MGRRRSTMAEGIDAHVVNDDPIADEFETWESIAISPEILIFSYEAYLYSQVSKKDLDYLEDTEVASQLVELGSVL